MGNNLKINIVYFAYLHSNDWEKIVMEQLVSLKNTSLYELADNIYISLVCDDLKLKRIKQLIWAKFKKIQIINRYDGNYFEYPGLEAVYNISEKDEESIILYFHTKGMTSQSKHPGNELIRKKLFQYTIENCDLYVQKFNEVSDLDIGGVFISEFKFVWYNFFWIRSTYVKNHLPKPEFTKHRYYWERWIGNEYSLKPEIKTFSPILGFDNLKNRAQLNQQRSKLFKL